MNDASWVRERTEGAPGPLTDCVRRLAGDVREGGLVNGLLAGARVALEQAVNGPPGRGTAGDLLAADALVTLALLAVAEQEPDRLAVAARSIRREHVATR